MECRLGLLLVGLALAAGCYESQSWDGVVELDYDRDTRILEFKRRIDLLGAGVRLKEEVGVEKTWRNAMGYTFVARHPQQGERAVASLRVKRDGVPRKEKVRGIGRGRMGRLEVEEGYWIVDVFCSRGTYLNSAVAAKGMSERRLLQHLGLARKIADNADRLYMVPAEQIYWRELLPVVRRNEGHVWMQVPEVLADSLRAMGRRYDLEQIGELLLVGQERGGQRCWHIFSLGEEYLMSILQYGEPQLDGTAALRALELL